MLIIPTSLDSAVVFELKQPLVWTVIAYTSLAVAAYCLWEMVASLLLGRSPRLSRWIWLVSAGSVLTATAVLSSAMFGPVTFNADTAQWVSTSWGVVLGGAGMVVFTIFAFVLLVLRTVDAVAASRSGRRSHSLWWLVGLCLMIAYGFLLGLNEQLPYGSQTETAALAATIALVIAGTGSLAAIAAIQRLRRRLLACSRSA